MSELDNPATYEVMPQVPQLPKGWRVCHRGHDMPYPPGGYWQHRHDTHDAAWLEKYKPEPWPQAESQRKPERDAELLLDYFNDVPTSEIVKKYGISRERYRMIVLREVGLPIRRRQAVPKTKVCKMCGASYHGLYRDHYRAAEHPGVKTGAAISQRTRDIAAAYAAGEDANVLAQRFGLKRTSIYRAAAVMGIQRYSGRRLGPRLPKRKEALAMLRAGKPIWQVVEQTGLDNDVVRGLSTRYISARRAQ